MSLKWSEIDSREQKSQRDAMALKEFLIGQQEERRKRKIQEKENERMAYRTTSVEQPFTQPGNSASVTTNAPSLDSSLPKMNINTQQGSNYVSATDDILIQLQNSTPSVLPERTKYTYDSDKFLLGNLVARLDQLQDQTKKDVLNAFTMLKTFEQRERDSQRALEQLTSRFDNETNKLKSIVLEFAKNEKKLEYQSKETIEHLTSRIDQLQSQLNELGRSADQVGQSLVATSRELTIESSRNQEASRAIVKHESAIQNLSNILDTNAETLGRRLQQAAQDLFLKIDGEAKIRRQLEDSIRADAAEFKRIMERQIAERMASIQSYTQQKAEADRREYESIAANLHYKLQRLEAHTSEGQEQLVVMINQRLESIESALAESERSSQKMEARIQSAVSEYLKIFESLVLKNEVDTDLKFKQHAANALKNQKILAESLDLAEQSITLKTKNFEQVIRAEIKTRMESDSAMHDLKEQVKTIATSMRTDLDESNAKIENLKEGEDKLLELIHSITKQITKSQEKWIANFEGELMKVVESCNSQAKENASVLKQFQLDMTESNLLLRQEYDDKISRLVGQLEVSEQTIAEQQSTIQILQDSMKKHWKTLEQKVTANNIQFDATLEALKIELMSRPTLSDLETKFASKTQEDDQIQARLEELGDQIGNLSQSFVSQDDLVAHQKEYDRSMEEIERKMDDLQHKTNENLKSVKTLIRENENDLVEAVQSQIDAILENQKSMEDSNQMQVQNINSLESAISSLENDKAMAQKHIEMLETKLAELKKMVNVHEDGRRSVESRLDRLDNRLSSELAQISDLFSQEMEKATADIKETNDSLFEKLSTLENRVDEKHGEMLDLMTGKWSSCNDLIDKLKLQLVEVEATHGNQLELALDQSQKTNKTIDALKQNLKNELKKLIQAVDEIKKEQDHHSLSLQKDMRQFEYQLDSIQLATKNLHDSSNENKTLIDGLAARLKKQEKFCYAQTKEQAENSSETVSKIMDEFKTVVELQNTFKQQLESKLKETHSKIDKHDKELKNIQVEISKLSYAPFSKPMRAESSEAEADKFEHIMEPLNSKLDRLVNQLNDLEIVMNKKPEPQTFYKPLTYNFRERSQTKETDQLTVDSVDTPKARSAHGTAKSKDEQLEITKSERLEESRSASSRQETPMLIESMSKQSLNMALKTPLPKTRPTSVDKYKSSNIVADSRPVTSNIQEEESNSRMSIQEY